MKLKFYLSYFVVQPQKKQCSDVRGGTPWPTPPPQKKAHQPLFRAKFGRIHLKTLFNIVVDPFKICWTLMYVLYSDVQMDQ